MKFFYTAMTHDRHRKCIIILFKKNKKGIIISFQVIFFSFQNKNRNILNKKSPRFFSGAEINYCSLKNQRTPSATRALTKE